MVKAAVLHAPGQSLVIEDVDVPSPAADQVRVRVVATGVCHSDLSLARGTLPYPVPCVLGHEGAGIVAEVGVDVTKVAPGDHVIIACVQPCHACFHCVRGQTELCENAMGDVMAAPSLTARGERLVPMQGAGTFAEETLVLARSVVPVDKDVPLELAALIGCAISTGIGAVRNTARVEPASTVAVIGCGGVGVSAIQGARIAEAERIIAIDTVPEKLSVALKLGATDALDPTEVDAVTCVREMTAWRGVDYAFEVVGRGATIRQAYDMTRRGGTTVVVGAGVTEDIISFNALELMFNAKTLVGCVAGAIDPDRDFPELVENLRRGELDLETMVTHRTDLNGIEEAFVRMEQGQGLRTLVTMA